MTWIVTGAGGQLGSVLLRELVAAGERAIGVASPSGPAPSVGEWVRADVTDAAAMSSLLRREGARTLVHAAAMSSVAACYADAARAHRVNADSSAALARAADECGARFVFVSTDMVFDGGRAPYAETAEPRPLSEYGRSKLAGERAVASVGDVLVARIPLLYGPPAAPRATTFLAQVRSIREGKPLDLFHDEYRTPLSLTDAARSLIRCARSTRTGILHLAGPERLSRLDMGRIFAAALGVQTPNLRAVSGADFDAPEPRARDLSLDGTAFVGEFGEPAGRPMSDVMVELRDVL